MKVSQPFPNFIQGVSQQPPALRLPSHAEELINANASTLEGLMKRPGSEFVARLSSSGSPGKIHSFNKSADEQGYIILNGDGTLTVKDFDGSDVTVTMSASTDYIDGVADPIHDFELVTVADYTFIVNRTVVPALKADTYPSTNGAYDSLIWVRTGTLETVYNVVLPGVTATYNPGTTTANANTVTIAADLKTDINGFGTAPTFVADVMGSVLLVGRSTGAAYDISINDGRGNSAMVLLRGATNSPATLPPTAPNGYQIEITGAQDTQWDNYYVEWDASKSAWLEIPKPGRQYKIDPATMPHVLRFNGGAGYLFEQIAWDDCAAGDEVTAPVPSFIGKVIHDLFFYRGRLGLLHDSGGCLSEAGSLYNFWRTTTTTLRDSDPIDFKVSMTDPAPLRWAVEFDDTVFFFSEKQQYYIEKNVEVLSPSTIAVRAKTRFEMDMSCQPVVVGDRLYYSRNRGLYSSLHDFYPKPDAEGQKTYGSDEVTEHAQKYIRGRITQLKGTTQGDTIVCLTDQSDHNVYIFQTTFSKEGNTRTQAALHRWVFDQSNDVLTVEAGGSSLYFIMSRSDGIFLERCDMSAKAADEGLGIKLLLDHRLDESQVSLSYNSGTNKTTVTLPHADSNAASNAYIAVARGGSTLGKAGQILGITLTSASPVTFTVEGDWTADKFYVGKLYGFSFKLSPIFPRDRQTGAPLTGGRTQVGRIFVNYGDTGYIRAVVTPGQREAYTYVLTGYRIGSSETLIGEIPSLSGTFKFPVMANALNVAVEFVNDTPFPHKLLNGDWEGQFGSQSIQAARRL